MGNDDDNNCLTLENSCAGIGVPDNDELTECRNFQRCRKWH